MNKERLAEILLEAYNDHKLNLESATLEHIDNNYEIYRKAVNMTKSKKLSALFNYIQSANKSDNYE